eukprot:1186555-Prorocentrum_minimum.AAC.6
MTSGWGRAVLQCFVTLAAGWQETLETLRWQGDPEGLSKTSDGDGATRSGQVGLKLIASALRFTDTKTINRCTLGWFHGKSVRGGPKNSET